MPISWGFSPAGRSRGQGSPQLPLSGPHCHGLLASAPHQRLWRRAALCRGLMPGMLCPDTTHAAVLSRGGSCTCQPMRDPCAAAGWAAAHAGGGPGTGRTRWEGESGPAGGVTLPEKRVKTGCLVLVCSAVPLGMPWGVAEGTGRSVAPDRHQARGGARHRCPCPCAQVMPWTVVVSLWMCTVLQALTVSSAAGGDEKTASCALSRLPQ